MQMKKTKIPSAPISRKMGAEGKRENLGNLKKKGKRA